PDGSERVLPYLRERTGAEEGTMPASEQDEVSRRLRAYVQHYTMSLINNSFYRDATRRERGDD
ncbi:MAG TPA: hypothetical protein PK788_04235, partial [Gemmatimonadaceae bacterium]|nr:hypothetical protein [Gemmatimonadaceae bacterium]